MIDPISLAVGAALFVSGSVAGHVRRPRGKQPETPTATCGCGHTLAHHDPDTNECHGQTLQPKSRNKRGDYIGDLWVPCTCRQYVGPRPMEPLFAMPFLPPTDNES
jgi:hypothetical protein